jgi:type II secretory ATPase GspE/PulE/Tfp pilus assembly ATPase PilB-like protein
MISHQQGISSALRRTLLLKVISKPQPSREDVASVIELTASKVVEALQAQSMTLYLLEGNQIAFKHVYYSPTLWEDAPEREEEFEEKREKLLKLKIPAGTGVVGKVIESGEHEFFTLSANSDAMYSMAKDTGFDVTSMLTVPLRTNKVIGAIQVLNKKPEAPTDEFSDEDLHLTEEVAEYAAPLLGRMLDPNFKIDDTETAKFIARFTENELVTTEEEIAIDEKLVEVVGDAVIRREGIFPYKRISPTSVAALMANPLDYQRRESFHTATELVVEEVAVVAATFFDSLLKKFFKDEPAAGPEPDTDMGELVDVLGAEYDASDPNASLSSDDLDDEESAPIIQMANRIIEDAYITGASDIHIEPQEHDLMIRYRIDGICSEKLRLPKPVAGALVARLKIMSELDIAEKRLPQDGRIVFSKYTKKKINIDLRVATGPMNFGEKVVMRILDKSKSTLPITALGFSEENLIRYRAEIRNPYGMLLHCGPTGSGKSMTLFAALGEVANPAINVQTAEDPIEYTIAGINQMQMHKQIGLTFAAALRCYLRMDPDVILVGEIRDQETAEIAIEAALTGHLLLSTLHTNDAPATIARFTDMDVEPFMISASLLVVCAQRLMRRVCKNCKEAYIPEGNEKEIIERALDGWCGEIYRAGADGCPMCGGLGYKGRVGVHELMTNSEELAAAINKGSDTAVIKEVAMRTGMKTLHQDSILKCQEGVSTVLESISTVPPDMGVAVELEQTAAEKEAAAS